MKRIRSINLSLCLFIMVLIVFQILSCERRTRKKITLEGSVRFATYNVAMFREKPGGLIEDLSGKYNSQAGNIAEIIQLIRPDVLALLEFDYDSKGKALKLFQKNYLSKSQSGNDPIHYPYSLVVPSNTGIPTGIDMNHDGTVDVPEDAFGFGRFEGQYAFAILSMYPLLEDEMRTFQHFLWKHMPDALFPSLNDSVTYYTEAATGILRLSSKNHIDLPVKILEDTVHLLIAHPTPPAFDGEEDRNGRRNYDEIRFFADYISGGGKANYIYDDNGVHGGLHGNVTFIIMGDMNADPVDGDSYHHAIRQLLQHPAIHVEAAQGVFVPSSEGSYENSKNNPSAAVNNKGNPWHDTSIWGLRIDYLLPSKDIKVNKSGVFWPESIDPWYYLSKDQAASDHMLTWMDIKLSDKTNYSDKGKVK